MKPLTLFDITACHHTVFVNTNVFVCVHVNAVTVRDTKTCTHRKCVRVWLGNARAYFHYIVTIICFDFAAGRVPTMPTCWSHFHTARMRSMRAYWTTGLRRSEMGPSDELTAQSCTSENPKTKHTAKRRHTQSESKPHGVRIPLIGFLRRHLTLSVTHLMRFLDTCWWVGVATVWRPIRTNDPRTHTNTNTEGARKMWTCPWECAKTDFRNREKVPLLLLCATKTEWRS